MAATRRVEAAKPAIRDRSEAGSTGPRLRPPRYATGIIDANTPMLPVVKQTIPERSAYMTCLFAGSIKKASVETTEGHARRIPEG
ncbi:hypothetical protein SAMN05877838_2917 [Hoeflea halophila]|uniref:Uncharacterized protein n=1 Tax=Hoeflea halophila TaxID=714899 RepID=A0A286IF92_9HYPH|nr:hypothetical protein SAMN05877838_2917 [Hoeflea halophila]